MKASHLFLFLSVLIMQMLHAEVSKTPQKKNFLIEKGTGHVCGSCPQIANKCDTVINSHPMRGMLIEYHFGPDAKPQAGDLTGDFRTNYGDYIQDTAKWPFYLNMMVNRKDRGAPYGSTFIFGPNNNQVQPEADALVNENSPVNLYMVPSYNAATRELTIQAQVYYTANAATSKNYIQIAITEDSIIRTQYDPIFYTQNSGFNKNFNHTNVFRENINGYFGDSFNTTTQGTLIKRTYKYTFPSTYRNIACNPMHCKLTMYVAEERSSTGVQSFTGRVMNAIRTDISGKAYTDGNVGTPDTAKTMNIDELNENQFEIYPNPSNGIVQVMSTTPVENYSIEVKDLQGRTVYLNERTATQNTTIDLTDHPKGMYFIHVKSQGQIYTKPLILKD